MRQINNTQEYQDLLNQQKPVLLDFYADWCPPCQALLPVVERVSAKHKDKLEVAKINVDKHPRLAAQYGVRSIPALFFLENKKVKKQLLGFQSESSLEQALEEITQAA